MWLRSLAPAERPPLALKLPGNEESDRGRVSAVRCMTAGDSAESKHRLWLFTPAQKRPRTAFGISLRAEALHPLFRENREGGST